MKVGKSYATSTKVDVNPSEKLRKKKLRRRYKCKACNKTFNNLTKTPLARLRHKEVWKKYTQDLINGVTIEKSAKHCKVANSTSFRWRHRMLEAS